MWAAGRATGKYIGSFPRGFLPRIHEYGIPIYRDKVLFPFGGITPDRENWISNDIKKGEETGPENKPLPADHGHDARDLPDEWTDTFPIVISDPPYGKDYSEDLYGVEYPRPTDHFSEACRVVEPGGWVVILDQLVYNLEWGQDDHPVTREHIACLTTGPNMRARVVNIFRKPNRLSEFQE
jgi:hypothetical protein